MRYGDDMGPLEGLGLPAGLGATGAYPAGSLGPDDEGELTVAMAADRANGLVVVAFGKPVAWVAMTGPEARAFARVLLMKAEAV
jgi:hypothetical protein